MRITNTQQNEISKLNCLVYGPSGAGKTSLAKTIDKFGPVLIISSEAGLLCLANHSQPIDVIDITLDDEGRPLPKEDRIKRLGDVYKFLLSDECRSNYKTIFIDSITEISENMIEALNAEFPERKDSLVMFGENSKRMRGLIKSFRDIPYYNVVFTALPAVEKDQDNRRYTGVSMVGNISNKIAGYFDEVFYLNVAEDKENGGSKRYLITGGQENLICKDRSGRLNKFEPADLGSVFGKIFN